MLLTLLITQINFLSNNWYELISFINGILFLACLSAFKFDHKWWDDWNQLHVVTRVLLFSVVPGGQPPLSQHSNHSGGNQTRLERRQGDCGETEGEEAGTHHLPTRPGNGQGNQCSQIPWVLGTDTEGS